MDSVWEVEAKFIVTDVPKFLSLLRDSGYVESGRESHVDTYMRHPNRDFRKTDEAFRLRRVNGEAVVTYKGPRLPGKVKTRPEIELSIGANDHEQWLEMYENLGFEPVVAVRKERTLFKRGGSAEHLNELELVVMLDEVEQLGEFAEIETIVRSKDDLGAARCSILQEAERLGMQEEQPLSYLSQLLKKLGAEKS